MGETSQPQWFAAAALSVEKIQRQRPVWSRHGRSAHFSQFAAFLRWFPIQPQSAAFHLHRADPSLSPHAEQSA